MTDISRGREGGYIRCLFPSGYSNSFSISTNLSPVSLTHAPIRSKQGILAAVAIADTGATHVLLRSSAAHVLHEVIPHQSFQVTLPNGELIAATHKGQLHLAGSSLSVPAYVFPDHLLQHNLLGISPFCRQGCTAIFSATEVKIMLRDTIILCGTKDAVDPLWLIDLSPPHVAMGHSVIHIDTDAEFVAFVHASFGAPPVSSFIAAIRAGYLGNYPRLTTALVTANLPHTPATAQGHLDQTRQRKTKKRRSVNVVPISTMDSGPDSDLADAYTDPSSPPTNDASTNDSFVSVLSMSNIAHVDLTGAFPVASRRGARYVLIAVWDGYVHLEPMASRASADYLQAYRRLIAFYAAAGRKPDFFRLDNESSGPLEKFLANDAHINIQYVPPGTHRANKAERAIRHVKNHIISMLCAAHPSFPLDLWDEILPQAELTINILRPCSYRPTISAYEGFYQCKYDFLAHPIAPFGTSVVVHDKPADRPTWAPHGTLGFYLGPALLHHRCWRAWVIKTQTERISDTLEWFPTAVKMPGSSPHAMIHAALDDLSSALRTLTDRLTGAPQCTALARTESATTSLRAVIDMFTPPSEVRPLQRVPVSGSSAAPTPAPPLLDVISPAPSLDNTSPNIADFIIKRLRRPHPRRLKHVAVAVPTGTDSGPAPAPEQVTPTLSKSRGTRYCGNKRVKTAFLSAELDPVSATADLTDSNSMSCASAALNLTHDGKPLTYKLAVNGPEHESWRIAEVTEWTRLFDTDTVKPIHKDDQPCSRRSDTAYYNPQVKEKVDAATGLKTYRIRGTIGGDRINYPGEVSARTADMEVVKILLNSVVSTDSHWMSIDIVDYYLNTPLPRPEYLRVHRRFLPLDIVRRYNLQQYFVDDHVLMAVHKGMYGLPQAGLLAQERLIKHLALSGYHQCPQVPCLFKHDSNGVAFTLVVDDFGIKYTDKESAQHLVHTLSALYPIKVNWKGDQYLGLTIEHDRTARTITLSMPGFIDKVLERFHRGDLRQAKSPCVYVPPQYGQRLQLTTIDHSPTLPPEEVTEVQGIVGSLLYYAKALDSTFLPAVTALASAQANLTESIRPDVARLLAYAASYPNNRQIFHASDMILEVQTDASYLSRSRARSVAGCVGYLGKRDDVRPNAPIFSISTIIDVVVASAAEAEYAAVFIGAQHAEGSRAILAALGHPQSATLLLCDNQCAVGLATDTVKVKRSKSIDMRFHWVRCRVRQNHFRVQWIAGAHNLADFFTKALPVGQHQLCMKQLVDVPTASADHFLQPRAQRATAYQHARTSAPS